MSDLQRLFGLSVDMLCVADMEGYFRKVNPAFGRVLGYSEEELKRTPFMEFVHPEDRAATLAEMEKLEHGEKTLHFENRYRCQDGSYKWLAWTSAPVDGLLHGVAREITDRKAAEKALHQARDELEERVEARTVSLRLSEARLNEAQRIAKIGNWERNLATNEVWWSQENYNLLGLDPQKSVASYETFLERVHPDDRQRMVNAAQRAAQGSVRYETEYRIVLPDGEVKAVRSWAEVACDEEGRPTRLIGTAQDITDRARLEREIVATSEYERSRIGHDLHDGLGQILVGASWSLQDLTQKLVAEGFAHEKLLKKLQTALDDSVKETRRIAQVLAPGFPGGLGLSAALQELVFQLDGVSNINCHSECSFTGEIGSAEVAAQLYRIAQESMTNALKHSQATNIHLKFEKTGDLLCLEVLDDGVGIAPERRDSSKGLGLRSMNYRARMINGSLEVTQRESGGTRVFCSCPFHPD